MKKLFQLLIATAGFAVFAGDYQWVRSGWYGGDEADFSNTANWSGGSVPTGDASAVVDFAPTLTINFDFHDDPFYSPQQITLPSAGVTWASVVSNTPSQMLKMTQRDTLSNISDPTGFTGLWAVRAARTGFNFTNGAETRPVLQMVENGGGVCIQTSNADGAAEVKDITGGGVFHKRGPGELVVSGTVDPEAICYLEGGTLTLGREPEDVPTGIVPGAALHLDASAAGALETTVGGDGRHYVTKWTDADDANRYASQCTWTGESAPTFPTPFVSTNAFSGLPLVDFGAHYQSSVGYYVSGEENTLGPAGMLAVNGGVSPVKELFAVVEITTGSKLSISPVGGFYAYAWKMKADPAGENFCEGMGDVNAGEWRINGVRKNFFSYPTVKQLMVVSVKGWGTGRGFNWLGAISTGDGIFGGFRMGEVVAYTTVLTDAQRAQNIRYLMDKWLSGREQSIWDMGTVAVREDGVSVKVDSGKTARVRRVHTADYAANAESNHTLTKTGGGTLAIDAVSATNTSIRVEGGSIAFVKGEGSSVATDAPAADPWIHLDATAAGTVLTDGGAVTEWKDRRAGSAMTAKPHAGTSATAYYEATGPDGKMVVNFGTCAATKPGLQFYEGANVVYPWDAKAFDTFIVWRRNGEAEDPVFSAGNWIFLDFAGQLYSPDNAAPEVQGSLWTMNGRAIYGDKNFNLYTDDGFNVFGIHPARPVGMNVLVSWVNDKGGGSWVGEYISFRRRLTDEERRNTIAYLMDKWGRGSHPDTQISHVGPITFATGVQPKIATDSPRAVASVTAESGSATLEKTGEGTLDVGSLTGITGIKVGDGALSVGSSVSLASLEVPASAFTTLQTPVVVSGTVTLAAAGDITVNIPADPVPAFGTYPVLQADAIEGAANLRGWTKTVAGFEPAMVRIAVDGSAVVAVLQPVGTVLIVR